MLTSEAKQAVILANARHEGDTGSSEVQIAVLTERIKYLTVQSLLNWVSVNNPVYAEKSVRKGGLFLCLRLGYKEE